MTGLRPPARHSHAMAYDGARRCIVVFGGFTSSAVTYDDTWLWAGTSWQEAKPDTRPLRRSQHAMAYDPLRQRVVMFGGVTVDPIGFPRASDETWEWDGTNWVLRQPSVRPPARPPMAMAYDYQRQQTILFGRDTGIPNNPFADTWGWDGQHWTQVDPGGSPGASTTAQILEPDECPYCPEHSTARSQQNSRRSSMAASSRAMPQLFPLRLLLATFAGWEHRGSPYGCWAAGCWGIATLRVLWALPGVINVESPDHA